MCFAGGGIKGAAHIGALKAFEEEGIEFEYISGSSSGSIIATLYSIGYNSNDIYKIFKKYINKINYIEVKNIFKLIIGLILQGKITITGLNSGKTIERLVNRECMKKHINNINQIQRKLLIPSVDLCDGKVYVFSSIENRDTYSDKIIYVNDINIGKAVHASCSYPGIFSPVKYNDTFLIDGGIRENVPWKELKQNGAEKVISIVFENEIKEKEELNIIDVATKSIDILSHELSNYELDGADYLIKIKTKDIHLLDKKKIDYLYNLGYIQARAKIEEIKDIIK
ncbi:MAG: hypothetical protein HFJ42_04265 [Clostridia bacterium]|nr:hypothetical protein [Clostridia bacterium]